eukprot:4728465-Prymnesium_polylepis.1
MQVYSVENALLANDRVDAIDLRVSGTDRVADKITIECLAFNNSVMSSRGYTTASHALYEVSVQGTLREDVLRQIFLLTDGQQSSSYGGDRQAISTAHYVKQEGESIIAVGFGTADTDTLNAIASPPASENAYYGASISDVQLHLSTLCTSIASPRAPPPPLPPIAPPAIPPTRCEDTCQFANDGICDDGGPAPSLAAAPPSAPPSPDFVFITSGRCADTSGYTALTTTTECMAAATALGYVDNDGIVSTSSYFDRPCGCTWHDFGNVELFTPGCSTTMACSDRGFAGCFCAALSSSSRIAGGCAYGTDASDCGCRLLVPFPPPPPP